METKSSTKTFKIFMLSIAFLIIGFIIIGFIIFSIKGKEIIEEEENGANLIITYTDNTTGLKIVNASPLADDLGIKKNEKGEYFDFTVDVDLDNASLVQYEIAINKNVKNSTINDDDIRIYLEKEINGTYTKVFGPDKFRPLTKKSEYGSKVGSMVLYKYKKENSTSDNYRLRMWLSDKASIASGSFDVEVVLNGKAE